MQNFLRSNPDVDIDVEEKTSIEIVTALLEGHAEFGIVADVTASCGLAIKSLGIDRLPIISSVYSVLASREAVSFAELLDEPFVGLTNGALSEHLSHQAAQLGKRINYRVRLRSFDAITRLVEAGVGVSIVPLITAERHRSSNVTMIRFCEGWADRKLFVCAREFSDQSLHARLFIEELERVGIVLSEQSEASDFTKESIATSTLSSL